MTVIISSGMALWEGEVKVKKVQGANFFLWGAYIEIIVYREVYITIVTRRDQRLSEIIVQQFLTLGTLVNVLHFLFLHEIEIIKCTQESSLRSVKLVIFI